MADDGSIVGFKGGEKQRTPIEAPDSLYSTSIARILDLLSEGDIEMWVSDNPLKDVFLDGTPVMNADNSLNFQSVQIDWRPGSPDQEYIPGFPSVKSEIAVGVELQQATPWVRAINNTQLTAISIRLATPALTKTNNENGDTGGHRIDYAFDLATDGGAFEEVFRGAMAGKTKSKYERGHRIDLPPAATGWSIRVRRISPDSNTQYIQDKLVVQAITEIIDAKLRYPYSAVVGIALDAQQFRSIPSRAYRVKGRVIRIPTNYNPITRAYTGVWDGTFKLGWTNNPAWIYYDMATNKRYGLGRRIDESRIDKWSLYKIAQYCDELVPDGKGGTEPRFTCTVYLQQKADAYKVMQDLASVFRGISYWAGGAIVGLADQPEDPVFTYTNANVKDGKFTYNGSGKKARHTMAMVAWSNLDNFGKGEVVPVIDEEGIIRYGIQPTQVTAFGATSESQAQRVGRWILASELLETDACSWDVGLDGTLVAPGKIVRVLDSDRSGRRLGGRISASGANWVNVDALPDVLPVAGDKLITITPQGAAQENIVSAVDVGLKRITVNAPFGAAPIAHSVWGLETAEVAPQLMRILGVTDNGDGSYGLAALQHEPGKFAQVENGVKVEQKPTSVLPSTVVQAPAEVTLTVTERAGEVLASTVVNADWEAVPGASAYYIQWKRGDGEWSPPEKLVGTNADLENTFPGDHWARVWTINQAGITSPFTMSNKLVVADQSLKPGFVDALNSSIANALTTAQNAQATADGAIESFWQPSPPVIGSGAGQAKEGDIWFDTDNGNKVHRVVTGSWAVAADDDMAQAIAAASTAQATADGKVKTFFAASAPTASAVGDLWFNTTTKKLFRWNGATWNDEIADVTLDQIGGSGVNILPDQYSTFEQTTLPSMAVSPAIALARTTDGNSVIKNSLYMGTGAATVWLSPGGGNIPLTPGKKYLVSFWARSGQAGNTFRPFFETAAGYTYGAPLAVDTAHVFKRVATVIDMTANTQTSGWLGITKEQSEAGYIDGIMVEELIGRKAEPSTYSRGRADSMALSAILAAANAQATADGNIDIFFQATPPATAKTGDYWQDSDDKKWYVWQGSWVESTDNRIPQAISDAAAANAAANTAQSTANSKIRLFYQEAQPTATTAGDQWYQPSSKLTRYWNGAGWSLLADQAAAVTPNAVMNPSFEQGELHWAPNGGTGFYVEANANALDGSNLLVKYLGTANAEFFNSTGQLAVDAGGRVRAFARVRHNGDPGAGTLSLIVYCYSSNGGYISQTSVKQYTTASMAANTWRTISGLLTVPAGTVFVRVGIGVSGYASGVWYIDTVGLELAPTNVDEVPDGSTYAKPRATTLLGGVPQGMSWGANLVPNSSFAKNLSQSITNTPPAGQTIVDDWIVNYYGYHYVIAEGPGILMRVTQVLPANLGYTATQIYSSRFDVISGRQYRVSAFVSNSRNATPPAGVSWLHRLHVYWLNAGNAVVGHGEYDWWNGVGEHTIEAYPTAPVGAVRAQINCEVFVANTNNFAVDAAGALWLDQRWNTIQFILLNNMDSEIQDGSTYGRFDIQDGFVGATRRIGLNVKGSRKILGGARNSRASIVAGATSVRTTTALSADSAGNVTVNAHTLELNGESVSFSAVTNAVTGLTQNVTYVIFTIDPYLDGGARTYYAQTSVLSAQQAGDGCVFIGNVTIPTSGSAGGGDGGGGNPGDWCVDYDTVLPDGRLVRDLRLGDLVECIDVTTGECGMFPLLGMGFGEEECFRLVTPDLCSVVQSRSTPMDLPDGRVLQTPEMFGRPVYAKPGGEVRKTFVADLEYVGVRRVCKPDFGNRMFFAGERADATIATHNAQYKP